ncbi:MAG: hypothetical protein IPM32_14430 [Ignavibacteriae bacterium]|nr:hypothetical protein [Ignavibacteriota bacterium]
MNKIILLSILFISNVFSQGFGFGLGYSTSNALFGDVCYISDKSSFHIGYTSESNDAVGKLVSEQKSNYGRTISGTGEYFSSFDLGYGYEVIEKVRLNIEISFASKNYYSNYVDRRFDGGGYHMITKDESDVGIGGFVGYNIDNFDFFIGYNSVRKIGFGLRFIFKR